jgi:hypothetical protein
MKHADHLDYIYCHGSSLVTIVISLACPDEHFWVYGNAPVPSLTVPYSDWEKLLPHLVISHLTVICRVTVVRLIGFH